MRLATPSRIIAIALVLVASAAPAASARFNLEPAGAQTTRADNQAMSNRPAVRANPDEQTTPSSAVIPPILRAARASELQAINRVNVNDAAALSYSPPPTARYSLAETNAHAQAGQPVAPTASIVKPTSSGFDYGDAAIGAAITAALALLITAGALAMRRRSQPQQS
jgi:uncharacterized protein (TIGR03382 family)